METRRMVRSRSERVIAGVAGGLGHLLGVDPIIVRLIFLVLMLINGFGIFLYLILWLLMPNEDSLGDPRHNLRENINEMQAGVEGVANRVRDMFSPRNPQ